MVFETMLQRITAILQLRPKDGNVVKQTGRSVSDGNSQRPAETHKVENISVSTGLQENSSRKSDIVSRKTVQRKGEHAV